MDIVIPTSDRAGFVGKTGSGKSTLALSLIRQLPSAIIVDTKREIGIPGFIRTSDPLVAAKAPRVIYRPPMATEVPDELFRQIVRKHAGKGKPNTVVYIDEAQRLTNPSYIGKWLSEIMSAGRSMGISGWWGAQQPTKISNGLLSQTEHLLQFYTSMLSHRQKLADDFGPVALQGHLLDDWEFFHLDRRKKNDQAARVYMLEKGG